MSRYFSRSAIALVVLILSCTADSGPVVFEDDLLLGAGAGSAPTVVRLSESGGIATFQATWSGVAPFAWDARPDVGSNSPKQFADPYPSTTATFTMIQQALAYTGKFQVWEKLPGGGYNLLGTAVWEVRPLRGAPDAVDDGYAVPLGGTLTESAATGALSNDNLGSPAATLSSYGGGSLGGAVTDNAPGASVALAGGTLTVGADGSLSLVNPSVSGTHTFQYRLANTSGTDHATVTIDVLGAPTVQLVGTGGGLAMYQATWSGTAPFAWDARPITASDGPRSFMDPEPNSSAMFNMTQQSYSYPAQFRVWEKLAGGGYNLLGTVPFTVPALVGGPNVDPVADAGGPYNGTEGQAVQFDGSGSTDSDGTIVTYDWDFGDGNAGSGVSPTHTYAAAGNYTITLTVTDDAGGTDSDQTTADIQPVPNVDPVADAGGPYNGQTGQSVQFDGSGSSDSDGTIVSYAWDFGDGNVGSGVSPTHAYAAAGNYTVTLTVTDDAGGTDSDQTTASIGLPPNVDPVADAGGPYNGTEGQSVQFDGSGSTDSDGTIVSYDWDFGDGNMGSGVSPSHTYAAAGNYTVTLTVTDDRGGTDSDQTVADIQPVPNVDPVADAGGPYTGQTGQSVQFDGSGSTDSDGTIVSYDWDFGDGNMGSGVSPTHTYAATGNYTVTLTVTDDDGGTDSDQTTAGIGLPPNVDPVADANGPYNGTEGSPVQFDGSGSTDSDGTIVSYDWDFGDGNMGSGVSPSHTYAAAGNYTVTLTVTDDRGGTDTDQTTADIQQAPNVDPVADANGPYNGTEGSPLQFDGSGSTDSDGTIVSYDWDFGDGNMGSGVSPSHTYAAAGNYTVTLTVTDDRSGTDSDQTTADIQQAPNVDPVADANGPYNGTEGSPVQFDGSGSTDSDGTIVSYDWDFGDGNMGSGVSPMHTYAAAGNYTVTLTVTDDRSGVDSDQTTADIQQAPNVDPVADANGPYNGTEGQSVQFDGSGSTDSDGTIVSYDWDFGDGNMGSGVSPSHTYAAAGNYTVTLTVTDDRGGTDSDQTTADIQQAPNVDPVADANGPYTGTEGQSLQFDGSGSFDLDGSIVSYAWDFGDGNMGSGVSPSHTYAAAGNYTVTLTVTDDRGGMDSDATTADISSAAPRIEVRVGDGTLTSVGTNSPFTLPIEVDMSAAGGENLASLTLTVTWDPTEVTYVASATGNFGSGFINDANAATGSVSVSLFNPTGTTANFRALSIDFMSLGVTGPATLTPTVTAVGNEIGQDISALIVPVPLVLNIN